MNDKWADFPVGTTVRCKDPDGFLSDVARKLRDRTGSVIGHQMFSGNPIVLFPATGRRKPYTWVVSSSRWVDIV